MSALPKSFKQRAHDLIEALPDDADWKDLAYEASVLQDIDEGLRDSEAGNIVASGEVRRMFGLPE